MFPPLRQRSDARMNGTHPGGQARIARERVSLATNCEEPTRLLVVSHRANPASTKTDLVQKPFPKSVRFY